MIRAIVALAAFASLAACANMAPVQPLAPEVLAGLDCDGLAARDVELYRAKVHNQGKADAIAPSFADLWVPAAKAENDHLRRIADDERARVFDAYHAKGCAPADRIRPVYPAETSTPITP